MAEITINNENKLQYSNKVYPEVISIKWQIEILDENILKYFPNLTKLDCSCNKISDLTPLSQCTLLSKLDCSFNPLNNLNGIQSCSLLKEIDCSETKIKNLNIIQYCTSLSILYCGYNKLSNLNQLQYCTSLTELYCYENEITNLNALQDCILLTTLDCSYNKISDLTPLSHCSLLTELTCINNKITSLEPLIYLNNLSKLYYYDDNPLNYPSISVLRFLKKFEQIDIYYSIYEDKHNAMDITIQESVIESVQNLMKEQDNNFDLDYFLYSELNKDTKCTILRHFTDNNKHPHLNITYKEVFTYVWRRLINNPYKLELFKILEEIIEESKYQCISGLFASLISVLVGFYDDIHIKIDDSTRIKAIITNVCSSKSHDINKLKELSQISLLEAGYDSDIINPWIELIK